MSSAIALALSSAIALALSSGPLAGTALAAPMKLARPSIGSTNADMAAMLDASAPPDQPPAADPTQPPQITGTAVQGQALSATPGQWSGSPTAYAYQWEDCDTGGSNCSPIPGATGPTDTLTAGDVGSTVAVFVNATNAAGVSATAGSAITAVVQTPSAVSVSVSSGAPVVNQTVTLVATVLSGSAAGDPSGIVAFTDQGRPVTGCANQVVSPRGQSVTVLCEGSFAAPSAHLAAAFTPSPGSLVLGSTSAAQTLIVGRDATTTTLAASGQVKLKVATTFTAAVVPAQIGPVRAGGPVQFLSGGTPIAACARQAVVGGSATCTISYAKPGRYAISANYLGDANFNVSGSGTRTVNVAKPVARGRITATMQWTFQYTPTYTRVIAMMINGIRTGMTVQMRCHGGGCPFAKRSPPIRTHRPCPHPQQRGCPSASTVSLASAFDNRGLNVGSGITIAILRPQFIGKYYSFEVRARRQPRVRIACIPLNATTPGAGC